MKRAVVNIDKNLHEWVKKYVQKNNKNLLSIKDFIDEAIFKEIKSIKLKQKEKEEEVKK